MASVGIVVDYVGAGVGDGANTIVGEVAWNLQVPTSVGSISCTAGMPQVAIKGDLAAMLCLLEYVDE